jgi:arylsulfatase A-like enzyme
VRAAIGANAQKKPNVVIMLADNVGYGDIGAYGAGEVRGMPTPRIDSIAAQGIATQFALFHSHRGFSPVWKGRGKS